MTNIRTEAIEWMNDTVYSDKGRQREVFKHENGRLYFFADPFDFDKDDIVYKYHFLDEFDGWKDEYYDILSKRI